MLCVLCPDRLTSLDIVFEAILVSAAVNTIQPPCNRLVHKSELGLLESANTSRAQYNGGVLTV